MLLDGKELAHTLLIDARPRFIGHANITWRWGFDGFEDGVFSSRVGPDHSIFTSGVHDLAHCVDFVKRGIHNKRMTQWGLHFLRPKQHFWAGKIYYDDPKDCGALLCEIRTFATQMILMEQAFGEIYMHMSNWDCIRAGYEHDEHKHYEIAVDAEQFAEDAADLYDTFDDRYEFERRYAKHFAGSEDHQDTLAIGERLMFEKIMFAYHAMNTPTGIKRIRNALIAVDHRCRVVREQVKRTAEQEARKRALA